MKLSSIHLKSTILYTVILGIILSVFSAYLFHSVRGALYNGLDEEINARAEQMAGLVNAYGEVSGGDLPAMSLMRQFLDDHEEVPLGRDVMDKLWEKQRSLLGRQKSFFRIMDISGAVILQSENLPVGSGRRFTDAFALASPGTSFVEMVFNRASFRVMNYHFTFMHRKNLILQLAVPLVSIQKLLAKFVVFLVTGILAALGVSVFVGAFLTRRILRPVMDLTRTANTISQGNLGARIPEQALDLELKLLVDSFNQMIDRLERSFMHINEFSEHVAHELKTPLTVMKGELELALQSDGLGNEQRRVVSVTLQETDRLIRVIKDLLMLAKFEYKRDVFRREHLDVLPFLREISEHVRILAAGKNIKVEVSLPDKPVMIQGDLVHLRRAILNLVHNATKFTPKNGVIGIKAWVDSSHINISVQDNGVGIAPDDQERVFEKFFRVRTSSVNVLSGSGLGLCLAKSIVKAHSGDITLESVVNKGSVFTIVLPLASVV